MKKLRINRKQLEIRRAQMTAEKFQIMKLTTAQAMTCKTSEFSSWEEVLARYGKENLLHEGEEYYGYVLVWRRWGKAEVNALYGSLRVERDPVSVYWADPVYKEAFKHGELLSVSAGGEGQCFGSLFYIWTFRDCRFDERISKKIADALTAEVPVVSLSDDEVREIKEYLGGYYRRFFIELD